MLQTKKKETNEKKLKKKEEVGFDCYCFQERKKRKTGKKVGGKKEFVFIQTWGKRQKSLFSPIIKSKRIVPLNNLSGHLIG